MKAGLALRKSCLLRQGSVFSRPRISEAKVKAAWITVFKDSVI